MNGLMQKTKYIIPAIIAIVMMLLTVAFASHTSLAWYQNKSAIDMKTVQGSVLRQYFHCGSGTADDPYVITRPIHYYNLTMLTEKGYFDSDTQYYFQLGYDLDGDGNLEVYEYNDEGVLQTEDGTPKTSSSLNMGYYDGSEGYENTIIPVGSDGSAFNSEFDGSGLTIENLHVKSEYENESGSTVGLYDIGVFGYVSANANIHDLYLDKVDIDVSGASVDDVSKHAQNTGSTAASVHTLAAGSSALSTDAVTVAYVGYIAGHVEHNATVSYTYVNDCEISGEAGDNLKNTWGYYGYVDGVDDPDESTSGGGVDKGDDYSFSMNASDLYNYLTALKAGSVTAVQSDGSVADVDTSTAFSDYMVTRNDPDSYTYTYSDGVKLGTTALTGSWILYGNDPDGHSSYAKGSSSVTYNYAFSKLGYSSSTSKYYQLYYQNSDGEYVAVPDDSAFTELKRTNNPTQGDYLYNNNGTYVFYEVYSSKETVSYPLYYQVSEGSYVQLGSDVELTTIAPGLNVVAGKYLYYDASQGKYLYYVLNTTDYPLYYDHIDSELGVTTEHTDVPLDATYTEIAPADQEENGKYLYFDSENNKWIYYTAVGGNTWIVYFNCFRFGDGSTYVADDGTGTLSTSTNASNKDTYFVFLSESDKKTLVKYLENPSTLEDNSYTLGITDISDAESGGYYIYSPANATFVESGNAGDSVSTSESGDDAAQFSVENSNGDYLVKTSNVYWNLTNGALVYSTSASSWTVDNVAARSTTKGTSTTTYSVDSTRTTITHIASDSATESSERASSTTDEDGTTTNEYNVVSTDYGYLITNGTYYYYYNGSRLSSTNNSNTAKQYPWKFSATSGGNISTTYNGTTYYLNVTSNRGSYSLSCSTSASSTWTYSNNRLSTSVSSFSRSQTVYLGYQNNNWQASTNYSNVYLYLDTIQTSYTETVTIEASYTDDKTSGATTDAQFDVSYYQSSTGDYAPLTTSNTSAVHLNDDETHYVYTETSVDEMYDVAYYDSSSSTYGSPLRGSNYEVSNSTGAWLYNVITPATYSDNYNLFYNVGTETNPEWISVSGVPVKHNGSWSQTVSGDVYISDLFEGYLVSASGTASAYQAKYKTYYTKNSDGSYTKTSVSEGDSLSGLYTTTGYNSNNVDFYGYMTIGSSALTLPGYQGNATLLTTSDIGTPFYGNVVNGSSCCLMVKVKNPYYGKTEVDETKELGSFTVTYTAGASDGDLQFTRGRKGTSTGSGSVIGESFKTGMGASSGVAASVTFSNISNCAYCGIDANGNIVAIPNITGSGSNYTDNGGMIDASGSSVATNEVAYYVLLMGFDHGQGNTITSVDFQFTADDGSGEKQSEIPEDLPANLFGTVEYRTSPDTNVVGGEAELGLIFEYEQAVGTENDQAVTYDSDTKTYTVTSSQNTKTTYFVMSEGYKIYVDGTLLREDTDGTSKVGYYIANSA